MRTIGAFLLGVVAGAMVLWRWGRDIEEYITHQTTGMRERAADKIQAVEERTGKVFDRAQEFLQDTREGVSKTLREQQDNIRQAS
jgi:hypothetical protein